MNELLHIFLKDRPLGKIDWIKLAEETEIYTCAEIEELANEAARIALATRRNIETQDIIEAKRVVTPSLTAEEVERMRCPLHSNPKNESIFIFQIIFHTPMLFCALECPCSAALRNHFTTSS